MQFAPRKMPNLYALIIFGAIFAQAPRCETKHVRKYAYEPTAWLDFEKPSIIIRDGTENLTYFGASIALHRSNITGEGWLFIGAPKARDTFNKSTMTGKSWRYNLNTTSSSVLNGATEALCTWKNDTKWSRTNSPACDGMFLSGSVVIWKDKLITCAPRWGHLAYRIDMGNTGGNLAHIKFEGNIQGTMGACYWTALSNLTQSHLSSTLELQIADSHLLIPFANKDFEFNAITLEPRRWEPGQFGFATHVSKHSEELIAGAVGVFMFDGAVILPSIHLPAKAEDNMGWRMLRPKPGSLWDEKSLCGFKDDSTKIGYLGERRRDSAAGYAITSGRYFDKSDELVAASSPRAAAGSQCGRFWGHVLIMHNKTASTSGYNTTNFIGKTLVTIIGPAFGSYFGAAMASLDINGDGLDELIVGAPLECGGAEGSDTEVDCADSEDSGCIHIYSQTWEKGPVDDSWKPAQRICSPVKMGRFGSSIAHLGDIDHDGFNDFAVGAPYEGDFGAVYVYFGRRDNKALESLKIPGNFRNDSQKIMQGFGQSVVGEVDLDGNGTPDFAVGDYLSQTVAVFRTRPSLNVTVSIAFSRNGSSEPTTTIMQTDTRFHIKYCLNVSFLPVSLQRRENLTLWNRLTIVEGRDRFKLSIQTAFNTTFSPKKNSACIPFFVDRQGEAPADTVEEPVKFSVHVWYNGTNVTNLNVTASRNGQDKDSQLQTRYLGSSEFCTECPYSMDRTFTKLPALGFALDCMEPGGNLNLSVCQPVLSLSISHTATEELFVLGTMPDIKVTITVRNSNQTAFKPALKLWWTLTSPPVMGDGSNLLQTMTEPTLLLPTARGTPCPSSSMQASNQVCQPVQDALKKDREVNLTYTLQMNSVLALRRSNMPTKLVLYAEVHLESDSDFKAVSGKLTLNMTAHANVSVSATPVLEQLPLTWSSDKALIDAKFSVKVGGPSAVKLKMLVGLPTSLPSATKVFEIIEPKSWTCRKVTDNEKKKLAGIQRLKELEPDVPATVMTNCLLAMPNPLCEYLECDKDIMSARNPRADFRLAIERKAEQRIEYLMNSAGFQFIGFAYAYIFDDLKGATGTDHSVTLLKLSLLPPEEKEIEAWVIIVAAASGLLFLSCVIFGLSKCGFFKREKMDLLLAQKNGEAELEEDANDGDAHGEETEDD